MKMSAGLPDQYAAVSGALLSPVPAPDQATRNWPPTQCTVGWRAPSGSSRVCSPRRPAWSTANARLSPYRVSTGQVLVTYTVSSGRNSARASSMAGQPSSSGSPARRARASGPVRSSASSASSMPSRAMAVGRSRRSCSSSTASSAAASPPPRRLSSSFSIRPCTSAAIPGLCGRRLMAVPPRERSPACTVPSSRDPNTGSAARALRSRRTSLSQNSRGTVTPGSWTGTPSARQTSSRSASRCGHR